MSLKHRNYLKQHENEYPFPLDGSNWARLVSIRLKLARRADADRREDPIARYHMSHYISSMAEQISIRSGLRRWTGDFKMPENHLQN